MRPTLLSAIGGTLLGCSEHSPSPKPNPLFQNHVEVHEHTVLPPSYKEIQHRYPSVTEDHYLEWVAHQLQKRPERIPHFLKMRMRYTDDFEKHGKEDYQSPEETVRTSLESDGTMEGDCEDYAILTQRLLSHMGILSQVVYTQAAGEGHAVCIGVEKNTSGKYTVHRFDLDTYERNGRNALPVGAKEEEEGYESLERGLNMAMKQYGQGKLNPYQIPITAKHFGIYNVTNTTVWAFDPELPALAQVTSRDLHIAIPTILTLIATYCAARKRKQKKKTEHIHHREEKRRFLQWLKEYLTTFRLY